MIERQDLNQDQDSVAAWIAKALLARGVDRIFGLQGGHIQPIWDHAAKLGIRIIDVRDEGAHMAHAHAELTGKLGVAMATAGPGVTNCVTGIANASLARAPVLLIGGCTSRPQANMGPLQDIPHADILKPVCRYSRTARVADQVLRELDEAIAQAEGARPILHRSSDRRPTKPGAGSIDSRRLACSEACAPTDAGACTDRRGDPGAAPRPAPPRGKWARSAFRR